MPPSAAVADDQVKAIQTLVADVQARQGELEPFLALHTSDAIIVNLAGRRVLSSDEIRAAMKRALDTPLAQVTTSTEIDDIRFVRPDVAIVSCTKPVFDNREPAADGDQGGRLPTQGRLTYVVEQNQAGWQIVLAQTTPIVWF